MLLWAFDWLGNGLCVVWHCYVRLLYIVRVHTRMFIRFVFKVIAMALRSGDPNLPFGWHYGFGHIGILSAFKEPSRENARIPPQYCHMFSSYKVESPDLSGTNPLFRICLVTCVSEFSGEKHPTRVSQQGNQPNKQHPGTPLWGFGQLEVLVLVQANSLGIWNLWVRLWVVSKLVFSPRQGSPYRKLDCPGIVQTEEITANMVRIGVAIPIWLKFSNLWMIIYPESIGTYMKICINIQQPFAILFGCPLTI